MNGMLKAVFMSMVVSAITIGLLKTVGDAFPQAKAIPILGRAL